MAQKSRPSLLIIPILIIVVGLFATAFILYRGLPLPQNASPSKATSNNFHLGCAAVGTAGTPIKVNDDDSKISYASGPWAVGHDSSAPLYQHDYHYVDKPRLDFAKNYTGATATYTFTGNQIVVGSYSGDTRGQMQISIDGQVVDNFNLYATGYSLISWTSPTLSCGAHTIVMAQSPTPNLIPPASRPSYHILLDSLTYTPCTPTGNACALLPGSGSNTDSCTTAGSSCQTGSNPPPPPSTDSTSCQGNTNAPAKCFDCNKDGVVNILDFSCFASHYGQSI